VRLHTVDCASVRMAYQSGSTTQKGNLQAMFNVRHAKVRPYGTLYEPPRSRMEREYDLFEVLPDGAAVWQVAVTGHENAIKKLHELSARTTNEVRVMHLPTDTLIAQKNVRQT
jgi:hypothetical protein